MSNRPTLSNHYSFPGVAPGKQADGEKSLFRVAVPEIVEPLPEHAIRAEENLKSKQYTKADAERFLSWITFSSRKALQNKTKIDKMLDKDVPAETEYKAFDRLCGGYSYSACVLLDEVGVPNYKKNTEKFTNGVLKHSFTVAHFKPIDSEPQAYLIDQTIMQFFPHDDLRYLVHSDQPKMPREHIAAQYADKPNSRLLGQEIIRHGYCPLNDKTIKAYLDPIIASAHELTRQQQKNEFIFSEFSEQKAYLENDEHRTTTYNDFGRAPELALPKEYYPA